MRKINTFGSDISNREAMSDNQFKPINATELDKKIKQQMEEFSNLLESLDDSLEKKKNLWKQIYENAVVDRKNAYLVFTDLYVQVQGKPAEHAIHGQTITKYMERMSKATDQLIKLAELVAAAEEKTESTGSQTSEEELYAKMTGS